MRRVLGSLASLFVATILLGCSRRGDVAVTRGQALFDLYCASCHEGTNPDLLKQPPRLHHLFMNKTLPSGAPADDEHVRQTIHQGKGIMPPFGQSLKKQEINDLLKYLHTL
jgi:mono/diheme cytochrome c family protein